AACAPFSPPAAHRRGWGGLGSLWGSPAPPPPADPPPPFCTHRGSPLITGAAPGPAGPRRGLPTAGGPRRSGLRPAGPPPPPPPACGIEDRDMDRGGRDPQPLPF